MESNFLKMLFAVLGSNKVEYVILRGYKDLPNIVHNDVDFFVSPESLHEFVACLLGVSKNFSAEVKVTLVRQGVIKCIVVSHDFNINIDFWYNLTFWGFLYANGERLLSKREFHSSGNFNTPDALGEFEVSFLKEIFHNQKIRCDKIEELLILLKKSTFDQDSFIGNVSNKESLSKTFNRGCGKKYYLFFILLIGLFKWNLQKCGIRKVLSSVFEFVSIRFLSSNSRKIKKELILKGNSLLDSGLVDMK